jgi:hypothetical protein
MVDRIYERALARQCARELKEDARCAEWVLSHKSGPMYWLRNCTKTENYHAREQGREPVAPFPLKQFKDRKIDLAALPPQFKHDFTEADLPDYLDITMGFMMFTKDIDPRNCLFIPKSRECMTSWLTVGFITWMCQFHEKIEWLSQSETDLKAQGLVKYSNILYANQAGWQKKLHPLKRGEEGTQHQIEWANGSTFRALPSGIRKMASSHPYGYFLDEAAHLPAVEATINIARPVTKQIIAVSSVAPGWFWDQVSQAV